MAIFASVLFSVISFFPFFVRCQPNTEIIKINAANSSIIFRDEKNLLHFGNFKTIEGKYLAISPFQTMKVKAAFPCNAGCLEQSRCVSFNVRKDEDEYRCELLDSDWFALANTKKLNSEPGAKYVHLKTKCAERPCKNGGGCVLPHSNSDAYKCQCKLGHEGVHCEKNCGASLIHNRNLIKDDQITASSFNTTALPHYGRMWREVLGEGGWSPSVASVGEYLQVELLSNMTISMIAAQSPFVGENITPDYYTTRFSVKYSVDGQQWQDVLDRSGNNIKEFPVIVGSGPIYKITLPTPFLARFVRFVVVEWKNYPGMRVDLFGCE